MFKNKGLLVGIAVLFMLLIGTATILYCLGETVARLESKMNIFFINTEIEHLKLRTSVAKSFNQLIQNDIMLKNALNATIQGVNYLTTDTQKIDTPNSVKILSANMVLINRSRGAKGSGTHIRLRNQDYILTCSHLVRNTKEVLWAYDYDGRAYPLKLMKIDALIDLALYRIEGACPKVAALELAVVGPKRGSAVTIVGNPDGYEDVITDGVISREDSVHYSFTNIIYFGNSGGAMLYRGKVAGVVVQLDVKLRPPFFVAYGKAVKLSQIRYFLKDYLERE